jgi:hypothetical protein
MKLSFLSTRFGPSAYIPDRKEHLAFDTHQGQAAPVRWTPLQPFLDADNFSDRLARPVHTQLASPPRLLLHHLNLKHLGPQLARHKQALALRVIGNAVQHIRAAAVLFGR